MYRIKQSTVRKLAPWTTRKRVGNYVAYCGNDYLPHRPETIYSSHQTFVAASEVCARAFRSGVGRAHVAVIVPDDTPGAF